MRVGFTATQAGMSESQKIQLREILSSFADLEFHHGDCIGGDEEGDAIAREVGASIVIHPPIDPKKRAFCGRPQDKVMSPKPYLPRNHSIVDSVGLLIAAPRTNQEQSRSGTWATIRYARKKGVIVMVLKR